MTTVPNSTVEQETSSSLLGSWLLATLRFAVTWRGEDKLFLLGVAAELDRQGRAGVRTDQWFNFFQRTSMDLCQAVVSEPGEYRTGVLQQHLARIDDERLRLAFAAAARIDLQTAKAAKPARPKVNKLWKGLSPRCSQRAGS